jgi:hypothetical protein
LSEHSRTGAQRTVGIVVFPEFFQNEGVEGVLDNLQARAGVTAIATSPYVMEPQPDGTGGREPPIDAGAGKVRLLDRKLWGRRELWTRTAPSFAPDESLYRGLRYQPAKPDELTLRDGPVVADAIRAAKARGLQVYLQVQAAIPPGYRVQFGGPQDDDKPRTPDGAIPAGRVDNNASLASPHVIDYGCALLRDLARAYPEIDGFHIDWPEFPPYTLDSAFVDFGPHAEAFARRAGLDFQSLRAEATQLRALLLKWSPPIAGPDPLPPIQGRGDPLALLGFYDEGVTQLAKFKAAMAQALVARYRAALDDAGARDKALILRIFPPPLTYLSGIDIPAMAKHCQGFAVKLFTMHWPMIVRFWTDAIGQANPKLVGNAQLADHIARLFGFIDHDEPTRDYDAWRYPEPDEPHPVGVRAQARRILAAREAAGQTPVSAMAHGYGPDWDFRLRYAASWRASGGHAWVNRYGYLADEKLDAIGAITRAEAVGEITA